MVEPTLNAASLDSADPIGNARPFNASFAGSLPFRIRFGFMRDVTEEDAGRYVRNQAERYGVEAGGDLSHWGCFPWADGYAFEVQEGGSGLSYLHPILQRWSQEMQAGKACTSVKVRTAARVVVVEYTVAGVEALVYPDGADPAEIDEVAPEGKLKPVVPHNRRFVVAGCLVLLLGATAFIGALRAQSKMPIAPPQLAHYNTHDLAVGQWANLQEAMSEHPGTPLTLRYGDGRWSVLAHGKPWEPAAVGDTALQKGGKL